MRSLVTPRIEVIESTIKDVLDKLHQNHVSSNSIIQEEDKASGSCQDKEVDQRPSILNDLE